MITRDDGQSLQKRESQKIRETESKKIDQIAYTTLLHYYLHNSLQIAQIIAWFSQNHRTANPAREPHAIWQRPRFLSSPFHCSSRAFFLFSLSQPPYDTKRRLRRRQGSKVIHGRPKLSISV